METKSTSKSEAPVDVEPGRPSKSWATKSSSRVYSSDYFTLFKDVISANGSTIEYEWFSAPDFCVIVPALKNRLVTISNYRYPARGWFLEFPAGHVEPGEKPVDAARRELQEETGYTAERLELLHWYYPTSKSTQRAFVFFAAALKRGKPSREPTELQRVKVVDEQLFRRWLKEGKVVHASTIVAYVMAVLKGKFSPLA
ncbi:MAG: NUDIX hydrolase [Thermoprotei archaeon]